MGLSKAQEEMSQQKRDEKASTVKCSMCDATVRMSLTSHDPAGTTAVHPVDNRLCAWCVAALKDPLICQS